MRIKPFVLMPVWFVLMFIFSRNISYTATDDEHNPWLIAYPGSGQCPNVEVKRECPIGIILLNPETGQSSTLNVGLITANGLDWSPDHHLILFHSVSSSSLTTIDYLNLERHELFSNPDLMISFARWSPDGSKVVFAALDPRTSRRNYDLFLINADGSSKTHLTDGLDIPGSGYWSPNGQYIAFSTRIESPQQSDVYLYVWQTGMLRNLTSDSSNEYGIAWSKKGDRLAFISDRNGTYQIYTTNSEGDYYQQITYDNSYKSRPYWVLEDEYIAYWSFQEGKADTLFLVDLKSQISTAVIQGGTRVVSADISPDHNQIVYVVRLSDKSGQESQLCILDFRISEKKCFNDNSPFNNGSPAWN